SVHPGIPHKTDEFLPRQSYDSMPGKEVLMAEKSIRPRDGGGSPSQDPCEQGTVKGDGRFQGKPSETFRHTHGIQIEADRHYGRGTTSSSGQARLGPGPASWSNTTLTTLAAPSCSP